MPKRKDTHLEKITSHILSRGLSFLDLTLRSSAQYAALKIQDIVKGDKNKKERMDFFLEQRVEALTYALSHLKGSVMKLGQLLSIYGEHFLPKEVNQILKTLQADSRPVVWKEMEKVLLKNIGQKKLNRLKINRKAIASASMGQVYQAKIIKTGEKIVLKVQYPGVKRAINSDMKALKTILSLSKLIRMDDSFDMIFHEIKMMMHKEADYEREMSILEHYYEALKEDKRFVVPKPYREFSSEKVIAMSFEDGCKIDSLLVSKLSQMRRNKLGAAFMDLMFKEIFSWRLVQTDPHFGNYRIRIDKSSENDKIILFDFGATRKFPKRYIDPFSRLIASSLNLNKKENIQAGIALGFLRQEDSKEMYDLFNKICFTAIEGFGKKYESPSKNGQKSGANPYLWGKVNLLERLSLLAKDAVFTFRLRMPPPEAVFMDRKMVGTYTIVSQLKLKMGPRRLISQYVK